MANFFIRRPIFAWVLAIILMMAGALAIMQLPVAQYPTIAPPAVAISATYPGADAQTVQDTVTQVIEQNMNGIDNLMYMSSTSDSAGSVTITLTFQSGTDPDIAQVQVQNKLQQVESRLPASVQSEGLTVTKGGSDFLMIAALASDNPSVTGTQIGDYISSTLLDSISRIDGVGEVKTARTVCYDILRELLREARQFNPREFRVIASPQVVDLFLDEESQHLAGLSDFIGKPISLQAESTIGQEQYDIVLL